MKQEQSQANIIQKIYYLLDGKERRQSIYIIILSAISAAAELIGVSIIWPIINLTMGQGDIDSSFYCRMIVSVLHLTDIRDVIVALVGCIITIYIVKNIYLMWMYGYVYRYAASVRRNLANKLLNTYMKQPYTFFVKRKTSDLIRSVNTDTSQLYEVLYSICLFVSQTITALCIVTYLAMTNVVMTLVVVVCLVLCAGGIVKILQKLMRKLGIINQTLQGTMIDYLQQAFGGIKEIKVLNTEDFFTRKYDTVCGRFVENNSKFRIANMSPKYLIETIVITGIMAYLAVTVKCNDNYIDIIPQLAVFVSAAYKLLPTVNQMYTYINNIAYNRVSVDLIYSDTIEASKLECGKQDVKEPHMPMAFLRDISLEHVDFAYEGSENKVLQDVSLTIPKGKSVGIIGPSGGGKTTLVDLILGIQSPQKGAVRVDDVNISSNKEGWYQKVGYIPQSIFLVDDSIRNNVAFGIDESEIDDDRIWRALEDACLKEYVESLPEQLDTQVGERGVKMSGGQRQRIGIARALYRNPEILFFDEATSALDNDTEKEVMRAIDGLHGSKTMIMIAHRLTTIENCDMVYKVENSRVSRER